MENDGNTCFVGCFVGCFEFSVVGMILKSRFWWCGFCEAWGETGVVDVDMEVPRCRTVMQPLTNADSSHKLAFVSRLLFHMVYSGQNYQRVRVDVGQKIYREHE